MATYIGERILQRRQELGWTQSDLAFKMGYKTKSAINKIETGINDVSQSKVVKFAEVMHTSVAFLMGWEEEEQKEKPTEYDGFSDNKKLLIDFAKSVPDDKAAMILKVIRSIVEDDQ